MFGVDLSHTSSKSEMTSSLQKRTNKTEKKVCGRTKWTDFWANFLSKRKKIDRWNVQWKYTSHLVL